jgi:hypothetical protein
MSKLIDELELKFRNFDRKIEDKINFAENLCLEQQGFNVAHFNVISLTDNYSTELNNVRAEFWFYVSTTPKYFSTPKTFEVFEAEKIWVLRKRRTNF